MKTRLLAIVFPVLAFLAGIGLMRGLDLIRFRTPPTIILNGRRPPVHYDTQYEATLAKDSRPLLQDAWGPFVEVLDEPVAVIRAAGQATTWEVFFATNRARQLGSPPEQHRFGNEFTAGPNFGRAEILVPTRRRGFDPARAEASGQAAADPRNVVHFDEVRSLKPEEFSAGVRRQVEQSRQHDVLLFVHGFNVDFESALIRTAQVALDLPFNGAVVSYCWPSQGGVGNYSADEQFNAASVEPFQAFLEHLLATLPAGTRVNVVVHSMGNRLVMRALSQLPPAKQKPLAHVVLCAPDIGLSDFRRWAPGVVAQAEHVTLYASTSDSALIVSKSVHHEQRAGDANPPVVHPGIDTIDVSALDFDFLGHSYYGSSVDVLSDIFRAIKERRGPETCAYLTRRSLGPGHYWYFSDYGDALHWTWHFDDTLRR